MASVEDRFKAAVNVIKGLPKNGPYQPSNTMMLKFYGYYKQATEGTCTQKKPAFWDVVGKAKWDAWKSNSHLTRQQAMQKYVDDLREIIETMSFTDKVADFVGSINGLDNINLDELDMIAPGMREIAESYPNSPFNSRTNSPQHGAASNGATTLQDDEIPSKSYAPDTTAINNLVNMNGCHLHNVDVDALAANSNPVPAVDLPAPTTPTLMRKTQANYAVSNSTVDQSDDEYGDPVDPQRELTDAVTQNSELLKHVEAAVLRMNADLRAMNQRIATLERGINEVRVKGLQRAMDGRSSEHQRWPKWWPFRDISPAWFALLVLWPFLLNHVARMLRTQQRK